MPLAGIVQPKSIRGTVLTMGLTTLYRPPWVGLLALLVVFLAVPLSHSVTMLVSYTVGRQQSILVLFPLGVVGVFALVYGIRRNAEVGGTLIGFLTGYLLWTGWASYAFRFNEISLSLPMAVLEDGSPRPMHLLFIQGSIGICIVTLLYFIFNVNTRCNAFMWIQRIFRLRFKEREPGRGRNRGRLCLVSAR